MYERKVEKEKNRHSYRSTWYTSKGDKVVEVGVNRNKRENCLDLSAKCYLFLEDCDERDVPLTLARLCLTVGIDLDTFWEWVNAEFGKSTYATGQWFFKLYRKRLMTEMLLQIQARLEEGGLKNKYNTSITTMSLKNIHGWKDKVEQEVTVSGSIDVLSLHELVSGVKQIEIGTEDPEMIEGETMMIEGEVIYEED